MNDKHRAKAHGSRWRQIKGGLMAEAVQNRLIPADVERMDAPGGNCPVQAEGSWGGREIYFRARGDAWSLSVESAAGSRDEHAAYAPLGNSGWVGRQEAHELARMHLWAWSWQERGLESSSVQGRMCHALRLLDAGRLAQALADGADPDKPLEEGGPLPLSMALALSDAESQSRSGTVSVADRLRDPERMAVWDGARDGKRQACVAALLGAGARIDQKLSSWELLPIHWAALLPAGQKSMEAGYWRLGGDEAKESMAIQSRSEQRRVDDHPLFVLARAGANLSAEPSALVADPLDLAMGGQAMALAEAMADGMGAEAMERVAKCWIEMAGLEEMMSGMGERNATRRPYESEPFARVMSEFSSGRWPLSWLDDAGRRPEARSAAGEAKARILAKAESGILDQVTSRPKKSPPLGRL
jgi:hypothetical protein